MIFPSIGFMIWWIWWDQYLRALERIACVRLIERDPRGDNVLRFPQR